MEDAFVSGLVPQWHAATETTSFNIKDTVLDNRLLNKKVLSAGSLSHKALVIMVVC